MTPDVPAGLDVSRETIQDLERFHDLLLKWTPRINLISKSSTNDAWNRHIWDSAQLVAYCPQALHWVDLGSGGGLPALVVAIFAKHARSGRQVTMVESDQRKSAFLRTVIRELGLDAEVVTDRAETCAPFGADVLSARALSDLPALLALAERHLAKDGTALFLKGETWEKEIQSAAESWSFSLRAHKSRTHPEAAVLEIKDIERV